ncbi:MAG: hypothetical protein HYW63_01135 [Candidatus Levybacteria bacterium]|nr:hypothetical protein [Candidatus Levybacteria bacterium]
MKFKRKQTKKVYKKGKAKESKQFPSIYRIIPEKLNRDETVFFVGFVVILAAILIISLDLYSNFIKQKILIDEKTKVLNEIAFWESEVRTHPKFRDAYFNLALLSFQLKNIDESRNNLDKSLEFDPNFEEGRELEKLLSNF